MAVDVDGDGDVDADDRALLGGAGAGEIIEVEGEGAGAMLVKSARAVTVIDTTQARERTADLGEVLSRAQGIQIRRSGGLGSYSRTSLNGMYDEQVRIFIDGVPLKFTGALGVAEVPVDMISRVEVHRGVVPIALGADALGGAIDLIRDPDWKDHATASYQVGSFGTHRALASARGRHDATGLVGGALAFVDRATNDFPVDVELTDERGRLHPATVRRFHDGYRAEGATLEGGVVDRGSLRKATASAFYSASAKELQHNAVMTVPYGEVNYAERAIGGSVDVEVDRGPWHGRALLGAAGIRTDFEDVSTWVYDWTGARVRERTQPGEISAEPIDQRVTETGLFARLTGERALGDRQRLRLVVAPTAALRGGTDFTDPNPMGRDPMGARRDLVQLVSGLEHELRLGEDQVENIAIAKHYAMWSDAEDVRPGYVFVPVEQRHQRFGLGDLVRWNATPWLMVKASYEWVTRLPSVDEIFGDGILVQPNLTIEPETSHNGNLGVHAETEGRFGHLGGEINGFARLADQLILLLGNDRNFTYQNVYAVRILGVEGRAAWVTPGEWASAEGSFTYQDVRNDSSAGTFGDFEGDRLPNRPWLLGSLSGNLRRKDVVARADEATLFADARYVHEFFRGWEKLGTRDSKQIIPDQLVFGVGASYAVRRASRLVTTVELQNLTDAEVYDSFGVQRPGRALYLKVSGEI